MQYGFVIPCQEARVVVELAREAEAAGWDGVFIPDCIAIDPALDPLAAGYDPWVALGAIAVQTSRVRLGTMLTPVSRRRPWKLARETATIDQLSQGRLVLPVGLGALDDVGFGRVGEATDRKTRAELLDEGLEIVAGLWRGEPFSFSGKHYQVQDVTLRPPPVQARIPIWVVGAWPRLKSMLRVLRWDGLLPSKMNEDGSFGDVTPADLAAMRAFIDERRAQTTPFDVVMEGRTPGDDREQARAIVRPFAEAGATWWNEAMWSAPNTPEDVRARIRQGPPRLEESA
jgi:hypothetical protein